MFVRRRRYVLESLQLRGELPVVQAPDKIALSGFARDGRIQRSIQNHLGLLKRRQLIKVAQEMNYPAASCEVSNPRWRVAMARQFGGEILGAACTA